MPPTTDKPALNQLLGDESARGIELAVTPLVFGLMGWFVDGRLGTGPWFAVGFVVFALVGTVAKLWFVYDADMRRIESTSRWSSGAAPADQASADDVDLWSERQARG